MTIKKIHEKIKENVKLLVQKVQDDQSGNASDRDLQFSRGQLSEAQHILEYLENIIYNNTE